MYLKASNENQNLPLIHEVVNDRWEVCTQASRLDIESCLQAKGRQVRQSCHVAMLRHVISLAFSYQMAMQPFRRTPHRTPAIRMQVFATLSDGQFQQISFVNSIATTKGGTHVTYVCDQYVMPAFLQPPPPHIEHYPRRIARVCFATALSVYVLLLLQSLSLMFECAHLSLHLCRVVNKLVTVVTKKNKAAPVKPFQIKNHVCTRL